MMRIHVALRVKNTFYKKDITTDSLTKLIFDTINKISYNRKPDNYLGNQTQYFWLEDNQSCVRIKAKFTDKEELLEIIKQYKINQNQNNQNENPLSKSIPYMKITAGCLFIAYLLSLYSQIQ